MNIAVCVKHIPDPNLPGELDGNRLKREGVQGVEKASRESWTRATRSE